MVGDRDEPPAFGMQEMNMAAGLSYLFKTKNGKDFNNFKR
jgi:hypothetical protein